MLQFLMDPFWVLNMIGTLIGILTATVPLFESLSVELVWSYRIY